MTDDRLRAAFEASAREATIPTDARDRIHSRIAGRERPTGHSRLLVGAAAVLAIAVFTGVLVAVRDPRGSDQSAAPAATMPRRLFAITVERQPVIVSARTGEVRVRFRNHNAVTGTQIAVSPDGPDAYFVDGAAGGGGAASCRDRTILRLALASPSGGAKAVASRATQPAVSRDGQYLAYLRCVDGDRFADELIVRDLVHGTVDVAAVPPGRRFGPRLMFDPGSRGVVFTLISPGSQFPAPPDAYLWGFRDSSRSQLPDGGPLPGADFPGEPLGVAVGVTGVQVPLRNIGHYLGFTGGNVVRFARRPGDRVTPATFTMDRLFRWSGRIATLDFDPSSRAIVMVGGPGSGRNQHVVRLYRWLPGDTSPTRLGRGYSAAAWIPDPFPVAPGE